MKYTRDNNHVIDENNNRFRIDYEYDFNYDGTCHHVVIFNDNGVQNTCVDYSDAYFDDDALRTAFENTYDPFFDGE